MGDLFYPSIGVPNNRPIRIRQEMQLHVPRVGGGLGRIVPRNVDEYPAWMFTGRVPRDDRQIGSDYANGAVQPLNLVIRDPRRWQNNDTRASRDIAQGTLNETHQNLESGVGQYFKQAFDMPYEANSRVDDAANATFAARLLGRFGREENGPIVSYMGADPGGAFTGRTASRVAQLELHAHGGPVDAWGGAWGVSATEREAVPTQAFFDAALRQERVDSVLISACNAGHSFVTVPEGVSVVQGLGRGYHRSQIHGELEAMGHGGFYSWRDAVVLHHGSTSQIIPKNALEAQMGRKLTGSGPVIEGFDEGTVGFFMPAAGEMRVGFWPNESATVPLSQAPMVTRTVAGGSERFFVGQEEHASLEAATQALVSRFKPVTADLWGDALPLGLAAGEAESLLGKGEQALLSQTAGKGFGSFKTHGWAGILLGGATLGALALGRHQNRPADGGPIPVIAVQPDARGNRFPPNPGLTAPTGPTESDQTQVRHRAGPRGAYKTQTVVELSDHPLDQEHLDRAFAHHLQTGYALT